MVNSERHRMGVGPSKMGQAIFGAGRSVDSVTK